MPGTTKHWVAVGAIGLVALGATASLALAGETSLGVAGGNDYRTFDSPVTAPTQISTFAACGTDEQQVSGGGFGQNAFSGELASSYPIGTLKWAVHVDFEGSGMQTLHSYVICNVFNRSL